MGSKNFRHIATVGMVLVMLSTAGCVGGLFSNSSPNAGQMQISNAHDASHTVVIHDVDGEDISTTVAAGNSETVTLFDTPGNFTVNATIDESTTLNYSVEYYAAGEEGEQIGGPGLLLTFDEEGDAQISGSVD